MRTYIDYAIYLSKFISAFCRSAIFLSITFKPHRRLDLTQASLTLRLTRISEQRKISFTDLTVVDGGCRDALKKTPFIFSCLLRIEWTNVYKLCGGGRAATNR